MWSVRTVLECVVQQGRRALQQTHRQPHPRPQQPPHIYSTRSQHKLSKCGKDKSCGGQGVRHRHRTDNSVISTNSLVTALPSNVVTRLVQGFVRKVSAPLWTEARRRATKRLVFGESAPFFALVGVTLVSESQHGLVTKHDELEALCCNIRDAISRAGWLHNPEYWKKSEYQKTQETNASEGSDVEANHLSLSQFTLGPVIGKGCNAVVYAARWNVDTAEGDSQTAERDGQTAEGDSLQTAETAEGHGQTAEREGLESAEQDSLRTAEGDGLQTAETAEGDGIQSPPLKRQRSESPQEEFSSVYEDSDEDLFTLASESLHSMVYSSQELGNVTRSLGDITHTSQSLGDITHSSQELLNNSYTSQELRNITQSLGNITQSSQELRNITQSSQELLNTSHSSQELGNITHSSQELRNITQSLGDITHSSQDPQTSLSAQKLDPQTSLSAHSLEDITRRLGNLRDSDTSSTSSESRADQRRVTFRLTERKRKDEGTVEGKERIYNTKGAVSRTSQPLTHINESDGDASIQEFPLAIKMMFNYEAESNAPAILRAMYKELMPARCIQMDQDQLAWQERLCGQLVHIPGHPNVVDMPFVFVDRVPFLQDSLNLYPNALPSRLNPSGYGRNMSLFCVMTRYDMNLRDYLKQYRPSEHTSLLLLTQLLEAILHINSHHVAHRDVKCDNILLSVSEGLEYPGLVMTDFGCSVASDSTNITVPFPSRDADPRQGNPALMAPEVITAVPGLLRSVNFTHSDIWAVGALAYEIYGQDNPFVCEDRGSKKKSLDSATYKENQLPRLPKSIPPPVRHLVNDLLRRNPRNRPSATVAATLCQLILWAPNKWLSRHALTMPTHTEIMQWLLCLTTKVLCEARLSNTTGHTKRHNDSNTMDRRGGQLEYELVSTFLTRVKYSDIIQAIKWNRAF